MYGHHIIHCHNSALRIVCNDGKSITNIQFKNHFKKSITTIENSLVYKEGKWNFVPVHLKFKKKNPCIGCMITSMEMLMRIVRLSYLIL